MEKGKRLIDANELVRKINKLEIFYFTGETDVAVHDCQMVELGEVLSEIDETHTVDAVEVVHGHWKEYLHSALVRWKDGEPIWADRSVFRCSRCDFGTIARHNYCPRCGADMRERKDNEHSM